MRTGETANGSDSVGAMRSRGDFGACLCVCLLCWFAAAGTASGQVPADLKAAIDARGDAVAAADAAAWDRLTTADFTLVSANGDLLTKAERLATLRPQPDRTPPQHAVLTVHGDSAIERYRRGRDWILHVWVRSSGGWQVAATQVTTAPR